MALEHSAEQQHRTEEETWNEFQRQREDQERRIKALRMSLANLLETAETQKYFRDKSQLAREIKKLRELGEEFRDMRRFSGAVWRNPGISREDIEKFVEDKRKRIAKSLTTLALGSRIEIQRRIAAEYATVSEPLEALVHWCQQEITERTKEIATLESQHRARKKNLRHTLGQCETALQNIQKEERAWIAASAKTLSWFLARFPERRQTIVLQYTAQHPNEDAMDPLMDSPDVRTTASRTVQPDATSRGESVSDIAPMDGEEEHVKENHSWRFVLTNEGQTRNYPLPRDPESLRRELACHLAEIHCLVPVELLMKKLQQVTRMTVQQRQQLHKLADLEPRGWKIKHIARFRAFLDIDEGQQVIRFFLRRRRDAYR